MPERVQYLPLVPPPLRPVTEVEVRPVRRPELARRAKVSGREPVVQFELDVEPVAVAHRVSLVERPREPPVLRPVGPVRVV